MVVSLPFNHTIESNYFYMFLALEKQAKNAYKLKMIQTKKNERVQSIVNLIII